MLKRDSQPPASHTTPDRASERGREALSLWEQNKPHNLFSADLNAQAVFSLHLAEEFEAFRPRLERLGMACAQVLDPAAKRNDELGHHPRLVRYDSVGVRTEEVQFHPSYERAGKVAYDSGIMALQSRPGQGVKQLALFYVLSQCGEMGHTCPIACTAGLIKVLQQLASPELQRRYLPQLFDPHYETRLHGAQFLTEVQGGSDVGANACVARPQGDGTWRITGEKWFCSNVTAELAVLSARVEGAPGGTKGLGLFLVPRHVDDGQHNAWSIRRLKQKIGTRALATAELDFDGALAYAVGPLDQGFSNMVSLVLNTSRLFNAVICAAFLRRAWVEVSGFAQIREAFGRPILRYPLVQEALATIKSTGYAVTASTFHLAQLADRVETGEATTGQAQAFRLLVNMNKYVTSIQTTQGIHSAIEVLGGNGAIEDFSILPRLYRDALVLESWEGAHNVLCAQVLRDALERGMAAALWAYTQAMVDGLGEQRLAARRQRVQAWLDGARAQLACLSNQSTQFAQAHMRRWVERTMGVFQALCLLHEAQWTLEREGASDKLAALDFYVGQQLDPGYDPQADEGYLERIQTLSAPDTPF